VSILPIHFIRVLFYAEKQKLLHPKNLCQSQPSIHPCPTLRRKTKKTIHLGRSVSIPIIRSSVSYSTQKSKNYFTRKICVNPNHPFIRVLLYAENKNYFTRKVCVNPYHPFIRVLLYAEKQKTTPAMKICVHPSHPFHPCPTLRRKTKNYSSNENLCQSFPSIHPCPTLRRKTKKTIQQRKSVSIPIIYSSVSYSTQKSKNYFTRKICVNPNHPFIRVLLYAEKQKRQFT